MKTLLLLLLSLLSLRAADDITAISDMTIIPTFHCTGIKFTVTGDANSNSTCAMQYKVSGASTWRNGLPLWHDTFQGLYKGSIVYLVPNTTYDVRVQVSDADGVPTVSAMTNTVTTWSEFFTEGSVDVLSNITTETTLTTGGSSLTSYKRYGPSGATRITCSVTTNNNRGIVISGSNIIIQNIDFTAGGWKNALAIANGSTNIIVRNCTFLNYGPAGKATGPGTFPDEFNDAALLIGIGDDNGSGISRVVVQNCVFGPAAGGSNSWDQDHPTGPHAIYVGNSNGRIVIRYNRIYGADDKWYNDAIGGNSNSGLTHGSVTSDSDIYGNVISEVWDDGIESEGPNENVRIFCNVVTNSHVAIATAAITKGPCYTFRNTHFFNRAFEADPSQRETAFKMGWSSGNRKQYFFFNTMCDPAQPANFIGTGGGPVYANVTLNNIAQTSQKVIFDQASGPGSTYDWDLLKPGYTITAFGTQEANAITNGPTFTSTAFSYEKYLSAVSAGYHAGTAINNFSDDAGGTNLTNPNMGAWDERFPVFQIGTNVGGGDVTAPTLVSAAIDSTGTAINFTFSETVGFGAAGGSGWTTSFSAGAATLTFLIGTDTVLTYTISRRVLFNETGTVSYTNPGNGIEDVIGNDLASFSGASISNSSTERPNIARALNRRGLLLLK